MKIMCYQCNKEIGEIDPSSDKQVTYIFCEPCLRERLKKLSGKSRCGREELWRSFRVEVNSNQKSSLPSRAVDIA